ncbi:hypothetical protein [Xylocopilactobacillus apis]|nr:hypothetical protein [Xylocopilactobacillus apis]
MTKEIFMFNSDRLKAKEQGVDDTWFAVNNDENNPLDYNPWNQDLAEIKKKFLLLDQCVILFRPAFAKDEYSNREYNKGCYFLEITNQDGSITYSSKKLYTWEQLTPLAALFKDLSFSAASRVWKAKKL